MPAGNGMGPIGLGPMTGRQAGYCAGYSLPGYMNPTPGRGLWTRFGYSGVPAAYGSGPYWQGLAPYGYGVPYMRAWPRWFGRRRGRRFGRGWDRGFGRGRGWGRW